MTKPRSADHDSLDEIEVLPEEVKLAFHGLDAWGKAAFLQEYRRWKRSLRVAYLLWPFLFLHRWYLGRAMPQPEEPVSAPEPLRWWEEFLNQTPLGLVALLVALPVLILVLIYAAAQRAGDLLRMHRLAADANHAAALTALEGAEERGEVDRRRAGRQPEWDSFWA